MQIAEAVRGLAKAMKIRKRGTHDVIASVTISAGVAAWMQGDDPTSLFSAGDAALYRAKESGRDRLKVA